MCIFKCILIDGGTVIGFVALVCNILKRGGWIQCELKGNRHVIYHSNVLTEGFQVPLSLTVFFVQTTCLLSKQV